MTNFRFTFLLARSAMLLAFMAVLSIGAFDYIEEKGLVLHPLVKISVLLICLIATYRWFSRELLAEIERRSRLWRARHGESE